jgi:hypothetical protein
MSSAGLIRSAVVAVVYAPSWPYTSAQVDPLVSFFCRLYDRIVAPPVAVLPPACAVQLRAILVVEELVAS